jgi:cobalt-zinc-cadmium efflux system outer membrane protein
LELERMQRIAVARVNALLRRHPEEWLPPPPASLRESFTLPPPDFLRQLALSRRPDLAALRARVQSQQAAVALAEKQFYPDTEVYGRYDTFWQPASTQGPLRGQVGVNVNMPIYRKKLNAALCEVQFRLSQRQAEYGQKMIDVQFDVESAYAQVQEAQKAILLYREKLLPAAEQNVETTRANYDVGRTTFLNLLVAQQQLLVQREQYQQVVAAAESRRADLERAIGGDLPTEAARQELPKPDR